MRKLISLINISKTYNSRRILKDLNIDIGEGDYICILGQSGVGKSTLLNIIGLIEVFDNGASYLDGLLMKSKNINRYGRIRNEYFGFVFQDYFLLKKLTVKENIMLPLIYSKKAKSILESELQKLLKLLQIEHLIDRKADALSGGEKQRVAIARALITNPRILICDEPTGNLDFVNTQIIMDILKRINQNGTTIILVTHDKRLSFNANLVYNITENGMVRV